MNMKKILVFILLGLTVITSLNVFSFADETLLISPAPAATQASFNDVIKGSQFDMVLTKLKNAGIVNGYEDGSFRPYANLTRAEFCKMTNKLFGFSTPAKSNFPDVTQADWFYEEVLIAKNYGYIKGFEDGNFHGNELLTRQQVCVILDRINGLYKLYDVEITDEVSTWAYESVEKVISNGLMPLEEGNAFRATVPITRREFSYVFAPFLDAILNTDGIFVPGSITPYDPTDPSVDDAAIEELKNLVAELDTYKRFYHFEEFVPFYNNVKDILRSIIADSETTIITQGYVSSEYGDDMRAVKKEYSGLCDDCTAEFNSIVIKCATKYKAVLIEYFFDMLPLEVFEFPEESYE
ncbi:MAG: S-layer homology domain-containing protein [Ruminococcaceae bacterium]|nr:S-layer homology domain-containing protein [Oscillospiraceae bacterium]